MHKFSTGSSMSGLSLLATKIKSPATERRLSFLFHLIVHTLCLCTVSDFLNNNTLLHSNLTRPVYCLLNFIRNLNLNFIIVPDLNDHP